MSIETIELLKAFILGLQRDLQSLHLFHQRGI